MTTATVGAIALVVAALVTGLFGYVALRSNRRIKQIELLAAAQQSELANAATTRGQDLTDRQSSYDQLQEDIAALREELARLKTAHAEQDRVRAAEIADVRRDLTKSQRRERILEAHAWRLTRHIDSGGGPPPPPWPTELGDAA